MQQAVLVVLALAAVALFTWWWTRRPKPAAPRPKARGVEALDTLQAWAPQPTRILTVAERDAYLALHKALPEHMLFAQVPLARFLKVPTRHSYAEWLRRVGQLCADLVVCDMNSQVVAVVEVRQPEAQESPRTRKRHARMDRVLLAAGIPLHVWMEDDIPTPAVAREALMQAPPAAIPGSPGADGLPSPRRPAPALGQESEQWEATELEEPPSSTWFDDFDSSAMPLNPTSPAAPARPTPRPRH